MPRQVLGRVAAELAAELDDLAACRAHGKRREAREVAVTVGILVDKALALAKAGGWDSTDGHLTPEASVERLNQLLDVWEERRQWNAAHPEDARG